MKLWLRFSLILVQITVVLFAFTIFASTNAFARNKIQFAYKDWKFIDSQHFRVYFYDDNLAMATKAVFFLERSFSNLAQRMNYYPSKRMKAIIYATPEEFRNTNILMQHIDEGVGGFAEFFKNRMVVPFDGDYFNFRHVLHHELLHTFIFSLFTEKGGGISALHALMKFPLWFHEGVAEYYSLGWDTETDLFMRDAIVSGHLEMIGLQRMGGFLMYKAGQHFVGYLVENYGEEALARLIKSVPGPESFEASFEAIYGKTIVEMEEEWLFETKKEYWYDVREYYLAPPGKKFTGDIRDLSAINLSPKISPDGKLIAFFTDRYDYVELTIKDISTERTVASVRNDMSAAFESFRPFSTSPSWSRDGKFIYFSGLRQGRDAIFVFDVEKKRVVRFYDFPEISAIRNPTISPFSDAIVFEGLSGNKADLFIFNIAQNSLTRMSRDYSYQSNPTWSPDGRFIVFVAEVFENWNDVWNYSKQYKLVKHDLQTNTSTTIKEVDYEISNPAVSESGDLFYFISYQTGIPNIAVFDINSRSKKFLTNYLRGITSFSMSGGKVAVNFLNNLNFDISIIEKDSLFVPLEQEFSITKPVARDRNNSFKDFTVTPLDSAEQYGKKQKTMADSISINFRREREERFGYVDVSDTVRQFVDYDPYKIFEPSDYSVAFTLDAFSMEVSYSPFAGVGGFAYLQVSDMLGNHILQFASNVNDINIDNFAFAATYGYLPRRTDFFFSGSTYPVYFTQIEYVDTLAQFRRIQYKDRRYNIMGFARYPLSSFNHLDFITRLYGATRSKYTMTADGFEQDDTYDEQSVNYFGVAPGYGFDNRLWGMFGPINGQEIGVYGGLYSDIAGENAFAELLLDYRRYWRFFRQYTLAMNLSSGMSTAILGDNRRNFYIGGMDMALNNTYNSENFDYNISQMLNFGTVVPLRGYNYYDIQSPNYILNNFEFRFPFIHSINFFWPLRFTMFYIGGAFFVDQVYVWDNINDFVPSGNSVRDRWENFKDNHHFGYGYGLRARFGPLIMKFDWALESSDFLFSTRRFYWTLGGSF